MRKSLAVVGLMALLGFAPAAKAVPVEVFYSVTSVVTIPSLGGLPLALMGGFATLRYQNATAGGQVINDGDMRFQSFSVTGNLILYVPGSIVGSPVLSMTGPFGFATGPIAGTNGVGASNQAIITGSGVAARLEGVASGLAHCTGALCGTPTVPIPGGSVFVPVTLPFHTVAINGNAGFAGNYLGNANNAPGGTAYPGAQPQISLQGNFGLFGGIPIFVNNQMTEISRTVVPEPGTASLVWLGLVGIAGARWHRRTRRG
jgi:hypothetical protein